MGLLIGYESVADVATTIASLGRDMNSDLIEVYMKMEEMHNSWYGKRYNQLSKEFNSLIPYLKQTLDFVIGDIPYLLEQIANAYSQVDIGCNVVGERRDTSTTIPEIPIIDDVGSKFITSSVESVRQNVESKFANVIGLLENIIIQYNSVEWQNNAEDIFSKNLTSARKNIGNAFDTINTEFKWQIDLAKDEYDKAERANEQMAQ